LSKSIQILTADASKTRYKFCKIRENRARDTPLRGVYIPHFHEISVKKLVLGVMYPYRYTDGGEIWHGGQNFGPLLRAKFHPIGATCRPCEAKNLKIGLWVT